MSSNVGFVMDKVALGQVPSKYFSFSCEFLFHQMLAQQVNKRLTNQADSASPHIP
jgi:hypothetical protein